MGNLIRAQLYQLKKSSLIVVTFICVLIVECSMFAGEVLYGGFNGEIIQITAGSYLADYGGEIIFWALIFGIVLTGLVCSGDFPDRTANYELMSGHLRKEVYCSRAVISLIGGMAGTVVCQSVPLILAAAVCGWGNELDVPGVLIRLFLCLFPVFRIICEFVFLSYVVKNPYVIMAAGFFTYILGGSIPEYAPGCDSMLLGVTNLIKLMTFPEWSAYTMVDLQTISVCETALGMGDVLATVMSSLVIGGLFLWFGYQYFKKDDLN